MPSHPDRVRRNYGVVGTYEGLPIVVRDDCPPNTIYFLPTGSTSWDPTTGRTHELMPGYYVNPRQLGKITNMT